MSQAQESAKEFRQQLYRARSGQLNAQLYVANEYEKGRVVEQNMQQAVGWYMRAARKGNLEAQFRLAKILHAGGKGVKRQPASAVKFYKAAAKRGHPDAQNWLGYAYQHGHGVVKNPSIAADWYKNAAGHGQAEAQNNLGLMYLTGKGVEQDHKTAAEWFQKAADQNHAMALNNLAGMYEAGWGVERSADKARELYQTAAVTGNQTAIANLKRLGQPAPGGAEGKVGQRGRSLRGTTDPDDPTVYETNTDGSATYGTSPDETTTDEPASDGTLSRGDVVTTDPNRPMTEQELERWLAQNDPEDSRWPSVQNSGQDPFGVLQKNWDKVNKQRKRRKRKAPSDSLR
ncbi:MAG: tetratricopeptide repeat protein [Hyphomicrobiales bacterium]